MELMENMPLQRPKAAAERDLLLRRDPLIAENEDVIVEVSAVNARKLIGVQCAAQVEPDDLGSERGIERANLDAVAERHGIVGKGGSHGGSFGASFSRASLDGSSNIVARLGAANEANLRRLAEKSISALSSSSARQQRLLNSSLSIGDPPP
jgi:hypothetical protein